MHERARKLIEELGLPLPGTHHWNFPSGCAAYSVEGQGLIARPTPEDTIREYVMWGTKENPAAAFEVGSLTIEGFRLDEAPEYRGLEYALTEITDRLLPLLIEEETQVVADYATAELQERLPAAIRGLLMRLDLQVLGDCMGDDEAPAEYVWSIAIATAVVDEASEIMARDRYAAFRLEHIPDAEYDEDEDDS